MWRGFLLFLFLCVIAASPPAAADNPEVPACGIFSASYKPFDADDAYQYSLTVEPKAEKLDEGAILATFHFWKQESREGFAYSKSLDYRCHTAPRAGCKMGAYNLAALDTAYNAANFLEEPTAPAFLLFTGADKADVFMPAAAILSDEKIARHLRHRDAPATLWVFDRCLEP